VIGIENLKKNINQISIVKPEINLVGKAKLEKYGEVFLEIICRQL
jgi:hypothetical protein